MVLVAWSVVMDWNIATFAPALVILWTAMVVWSYGKRVVLPVKATPGGFEVKIRVHSQHRTSVLDSDMPLAFASTAA